MRTNVHPELVPTLKPGDIVIADNLGSRKDKAACKAIQNAGAHLILLPKYSLDLDPIQQVFVKLKHLLRKGAAKSCEAVSDTIAELLSTYTPAECAN